MSVNTQHRLFASIMTAKHGSIRKNVRAIACASLLGTACLGIAGGTPRANAQIPAGTPLPVAVLHVSDVRQPIYRFGGSQTYSGDALATFSNRAAVYKALFQDLKIDIFRLRNYNAYPEEQAQFDSLTREFAGGARTWGSDPGTRGGKLPVRLMFTSWSPPSNLKSNNRVSGRSDGTDAGLPDATLKKDASGHYIYSRFADWWLDSLQKFQSLTGALPDYIALQNELEFPASYEGCLFGPTEAPLRNGYISSGLPLAGYEQALAAVSDRVTKTFGAHSPKIVGPETFSLQTNLGGPNHVLDYVDPSTATGKADLKRLFGISYHIYGAGAAGGDAGPNPALFKAGLNAVRDAYRMGGLSKPIFQNEFLEGATMTAVAGIISDTFTEGDASAYLVWIAARSIKQPGGYALVYYNTDDGSVERRDRFYAVKAFSEFVGEGWHRIGADCSDPDLKISAYQGPQKGDLVTVLVNPTPQEHKVTLTSDSDAYRTAATALYRSSEGENGEHWHELGALPAGNVVTLTPHSVVTVKLSHP